MDGRARSRGDFFFLLEGFVWQKGEPRSVGMFQRERRRRKVAIGVMGNSRQALCMQRASSGTGGTYPDGWEGEKTGGAPARGDIDSRTMREMQVCDKRRQQGFFFI